MAFGRLIRAPRGGMGGSEDVRWGALDRALEAAVARAREGEARPTLLYSGGVDSSLLAHALPPGWRGELLAVGLPSARDLRAAAEGAAALGRPLRTVLLEPAEIARRAEAIEASFGPLPEPARSVQVALALAVEAALGGTVIVGQGADELFGGYAHFRGLGRAAAEARRRADLERLVEVDWPLSVRLSEASGKRLRAPYLDPEFLALARGLPLEEVGPGGLTKPSFRRWAAHRGLPASIVERPKLAMQYGSGVRSALGVGGATAGPPEAPRGRSSRPAR